MNKKVWAAAGIIVVLFCIFNFEHAIRIGKAIGSAMYPVFIGLLFALILNAPVKLLENTLLSSPKLKKVRRIGALLITLLAAGGILTLAGFLLVPEIIESIQAIAGKLPDLEENGWSSFFGTKLPQFASDNLDKLMAQLTDGLENILPQAMQFFKNTLKTVTNVLLGLFMGILILLSKEKLVESLRKMLMYISDEEKTKKTIASLAMATDKFSRFLAGQIFEAFIFGIMCMLAFFIFKIPYAPLAAVIMAFANLIPMVGGYIGGVVAFLFIFSASPAKALVFVIVILVVQQIEQVTTYPVVVGKYVGLSSFWILFSVVVGGGLFGFWGLVLGVPVVAFIHQFFKVMYHMKQKKDLRI